MKRWRTAMAAGDVAAAKIEMDFIKSSSIEDAKKLKDWTLGKSVQTA
jgi:hypothetical protein